MKINFGIKDTSLVTSSNTVKEGDLVLCAQNIYNKPKMQEQKAKMIIFGKGQNYKVVEHKGVAGILAKLLGPISFIVVNSLGTEQAFGYDTNEKEKYFYKYENKVGS